jgi:hypothetical protein
MAVAKLLMGLCWEEQGVITYVFLVWHGKWGLDAS